jgi:hypothetical protein
MMKLPVGESKSNSFQRVRLDNLISLEFRMTSELDNRTMENKTPRDTCMALQFELRTLSESPDTSDTVMKCLKRIKLLLQEKREHIRLSNEAGPDEYCSVIDEKAPTVVVKSTPIPNHFSSVSHVAC